MKNPDSGYIKLMNIIIPVLCIISFFPVFSAEFINYDDPEYILLNPYIKEFSFDNIAAIFAGKPTVLYVPLTIFSFLLEYSAFGANPVVFHTVNLLLHIFNALILLRILLKLDIKNQYLVSTLLLFFTIHPLVTESVCWITERKDVLYSLFYLLSAYQFLTYLESRGRKNLVLCFLFFILACLSKPMAVTLPVLMTLYLFYRAAPSRLREIKVLIPFYFISVIFSIYAFYAVSQSVPDKELNLNYGLPEKAAVLLAELGFYFFKPFAPGLHLFYLFPQASEVFKDTRLVTYMILGILLIAGMVYFYFKKNRLMLYLFSAWIIFILPVLQLDSNNHSYVNERYFYMGILFPAYAFFSVLSPFVKEVTFRNLLILVSLCFMVLTFSRAKLWKKTVSLFEYERKNDPSNPMVLNNLGFYYNSTSQFAKAKDLLYQAISIDPEHSTYLNNYGWSLSGLGDLENAIVYFTKAIEKKPRFVVALNNLGICYAQKGELSKAYPYFTRSYEIDPDNNETLYYLGLYYLKSGEKEKARAFFQNAADRGNKEAEKYLLSPL